MNGLTWTRSPFEQEICQWHCSGCGESGEFYNTFTHGCKGIITLTKKYDVPSHKNKPRSKKPWYRELE